MATAIAMETSKVSVDMAINRDCSLFVNKQFLFQLNDLMSRLILLYFYLVCFVANYIIFVSPNYNANERPGVGLWGNISTSSRLEIDHRALVFLLSNQLFFPTSPVNESPDKNDDFLSTRTLPHSFSSTLIVLLCLIIHD